MIQQQFHTVHDFLEVDDSSNDSNDSNDGSGSTPNSRLDRMMKKYFPDDNDALVSVSDPRTEEMSIQEQRNTTGPLGMGVLMEALRRDAIRHADDCKDSVGSLSSDNSIDSDDELEQWAQQIRGEIRNSEMVELALEAERAADAGEEHFAGHPSTFGTDIEAESTSSSKKLKPLPRLRSYTEGATIARSPIRMLSEKKTKLRVLALRNVTEVIPLLQELHLHLSAHISQSGIGNTTSTIDTSEAIDTDETFVTKPHTSPQMRFLRKFSNWVSPKNSKEEDTISPAGRMLSLFDEDDEEKSVNSQSEYEVGDVLAEHFRQSKSKAGVKLKYIRIPQGLLLPTDEDDDGIFCDARLDSEKTDVGTLGTAATSSSSEMGRHNHESVMTLPVVTRVKEQLGPRPICLRAPIPFSVDFDSPAPCGDHTTPGSILGGNSSFSERPKHDTSLLDLPNLFVTPVKARSTKAFGGLQRSHLGSWSFRQDETYLIPRILLNRETSVGDAQHKEKLSSSASKGEFESHLIIPLHSNRGQPNHTLQPRSQIVHNLLNNSLESSFLDLGTNSDFLEQPDPESIDDDCRFTRRFSTPPIALHNDNIAVEIHNPTETKELIGKAISISPEMDSSVPFLNMDMYEVACQEANEVAFTTLKKPDKPVVETVSTIKSAASEVSLHSLQEEKNAETTLAMGVSIVDQTSQRDSIRTAVLPCGCDMILSRSISSGSKPGPPLHSSSLDFARDNAQGKSHIRRVTSCPSLADHLSAPEISSPISVKGTMDTPARAGCLGDETHSFSAAAMRVFMRMSPTRGDVTFGHHKGMQLTRTENVAFLNNYLYCSKGQEMKLQESYGDPRFCVEPCGGMRNDEPCGELGTGCNGLSGVVRAVTFIFPTKVMTRDPLILDPGTYHGALHSETWFDAATERFDGAIERFVGSGREQSHTWNLFQAPSLKVKSPNVSRLTSSQIEPSDKVEGILLVKGLRRGRSTDSGKYDSDSSERQWQSRYGAPKVDFRLVPMSEQVGISEISLEGQSQWLSKAMSTSFSGDQVLQQ